MLASLMMIYRKILGFFLGGIEVQPSIYSLVVILLAGVF